MIVVLDTNVIVSGLYSPSGSPGRTLNAWHGGQYELVVSTPLLDELRIVLARPRIMRWLRWTDERDRALFAAFDGRATLVEPAFRLAGIVKDEADHRVLEAALEGRADCIVTGDAALLALAAYEGVAILDPLAFLAELRRQQS